MTINLVKKLQMYIFIYKLVDVVNYRVDTISSKEYTNTKEFSLLIYNNIIVSRIEIHPGTKHVLIKLRLQI